MQDKPKGQKFTEQAEDIILEHLSDEHFGVSELAEAMYMSRSSLLRKCKKQTGLSASQFIRKIRLEQAMEMLQDSDQTVSEVSYQVGFGSSSYFIKCFREEYGYPPGEVGNQTLEVEKEEKSPKIPFYKKYNWAIGLASIVLLAVLGFLLIPSSPTSNEPMKSEVEKSIAVLPFKNESSDSTNLYFVNGLMEASLGNLQKIEDLRVISRTSVEKYRHSDKNIGEIASELDVNYIVEGSGQKVGDQVLLHIQLIDAATDTPIWGQQYTQEVVDIFALQNEVAKKIADAIKAKVTASELEQIDKKPTDNLAAYDYYLQAQEPFNRETIDGLLEAIPLFEKAIEEDPEFSLVYADLAIAYYYLDLYKKEKQYTETINNYADKALLHDSKLTESLMAKALYYMHIEDYRLAIPYLDKALEYNPNSSAVVNMLSSIYSNALPDTGKYLENALKGIQLDVAENNVTQSYIYLNLSNALAQSGFTDEALTYIDKSLEVNPENYYAPYLKAFIRYAKNKDLNQTLNALKRELRKDTTRLDILQEVAKLHYFQREFDSAYHYYKPFNEIRKSRGLNIYPQEDIKIGVTYEKMGFQEEADQLIASYEEYCKNDQSIYQPASMAVLYAYEGKYAEAIEEYEKFSTKNHFQYWMILFMDMDPALDSLKSYPGYDEAMQKIEERFWENHNLLKATLEEKGLL
ncbi:helix-turn-helix domain-containing protein [Flagellimonas zhangzhouensis]|uniref:Transcriptional regulator, AraC family n=1 Tax=Flagellimonas zhangzhouensis TaxID=1073328 RepID=A0A1H2SIC5_9FLAO|nr:helix-turn-helix domain-containing protein [Allomuricauda zhangzhouensis]SDQ75111.1 TolB amino-terminal domain-containing protein [Allomuricauda zhangzhouensis]SDW31277.1 transcriptional regulator, AraC family [Allomuricauda zhangzhouensis]